MNVQVHDCLPCCSTYIDAYIVTVRLKICVQVGFTFLYQGPERMYFFRSSIKVIAKVSFGDDQEMAFVDGVFVKYGKGQAVLQDLVGSVAERAGNGEPPPVGV